MSVVEEVVDDVVVADLNQNNSLIETYISDAWHKFCNAGDPIKPNFIKEKKHNKKQIYFAIDDVEFEYPKLS